MQVNQQIDIGGNDYLFLRKNTQTSANVTLYVHDSNKRMGINFEIDKKNNTYEIDKKNSISNPLEIYEIVTEKKGKHESANYIMTFLKREATNGNILTIVNNNFLLVNNNESIDENANLILVNNDNFNENIDNNQKNGFVGVNGPSILNDDDADEIDEDGFILVNNP